MKKLLNARFVFVLIALMAVVTVASAQGPLISQELTVDQQSATIGATACEFAGGFSVGLGVAAFFGCAICGAGSLILGAGALILC